MRDGDLVTYIAGNRIPASPYSVGSLVDVIKCGCCRCAVALRIYTSARCESELLNKQYAR